MAEKTRERKESGMARCFPLGLAKFHPSNLKRKMVTEASIIVTFLYTCSQHYRRKWWEKMVCPGRWAQCTHPRSNLSKTCFFTSTTIRSIMEVVLLKFLEVTVWFVSCCLHWAIPLFKGGHHLVVCRLFNRCHCQYPSLCLCVSFFWLRKWLCMGFD